MTTTHTTTGTDPGDNNGTNAGAAPVLTGRLHPVTAARRIWLQVCALGWLVYGNRDDLTDATDHLGLLGTIAAVATPLLVFTAGTATLVIVSWRKTSFTLTRTHLHYHWGNITRTQRQIPLAQIKALDIERPFFGRPLGVRALSINTATQHTRLAYLSPHHAQHLQTEITALTGAPEHTTGAATVAHVTTAQLAVSMLLDARLFIRLIVGCAVSLIPFLLSGHALSLGLLLPWARSAWKATAARFPRLHNWTITEVPGGYRTERGLFNRHQHTWQADRITSITLHQPILWRSRDWVRIEAGVIGYTNRLLLPVATRTQAEKICARIFGLEALDALHTPQPAPRRARRCTPFWRACAFSRTPGFAAAWRGLFLKQTVTLAPLPRVLRINVTQTWWQRLHRLAGFRLDVPGGADVTATYRDADEARRLTEPLREQTTFHALAGTPIPTRTSVRV